MDIVYTYLGKNSIKDIEDIIAFKGRLVSASDIQTALRGKYTSKMISKKIFALKSGGWLIAFKKGVYYIADISSRGFAGISPFAIAGVLNEISYVTAESALSYHGYFEQMQNTITSVTLKKSKEYEFQGKHYRYSHLKEELYSGYKEVQVDGLKAKIAGVEKAILDLLYLRHDRLSCETVLETFEKAAGVLDINVFISTVKEYPDTTKRLLGHLLDKAGKDTQELKKIVRPTGVSRMSTGADKFNAKWRLYYED